jgi:hypothetical protein
LLQWRGGAIAQLALPQTNQPKSRRFPRGESPVHCKRC